VIQKLVTDTHVDCRYRAKCTKHRHINPLCCLLNYNKVQPETKHAILEENGMLLTIYEEIMRS